MPKTYVLDSSVLLSTGKQALFAFADNEVVLPLVVIKELEGKRTDPIVGWIARSVLRTLEDLRVSKNDSLGKGVKVNEEGGTVRIEINHIDQSSLPGTMRNGTHDTRILAVAHNLKASGDNDVILVSNDLPMRILAEVGLGLQAEPFNKNKNGVQGDYTGITEVEVSYDTIHEFFAEGKLDIDDAKLPENTGINTGVHLRSGSSNGIAVRRGNTLCKVERGVENVFGARGRSLEQKIALEHLMNPDLPVVSLGGPAGTGKTLLALAAGLEQTIEVGGPYSKVMVFRPLHAVGGENLGYLPGTEEEKMNPWGAAIYDALEAITDRNVIDAIVRNKQLEVIPVTHIRGRTFNKTFVIVDEAQNLERTTLLTVLSRLGQGSKAVFSWDASQRDNLNIGRHDGIVPIVERLKNEREFAHVTLNKSERSSVAELATRVLDDLEI